MKKLLLISVILLCANSFGQLKIKETPKSIEIGKITPMGKKSMYCQKVDDSYYVFFYRDARYDHIDEWESFYLKDTNDFNSLYSIIMNNFATAPKEPVAVESTNGTINLYYKKFTGGRTIRFSSGDGSGISDEFTQKQVNKLFGKR